MIVCLSRFLQKKSPVIGVQTFSYIWWLWSGSGILESGNFLLKLDGPQSGKFAPRENNLLYGINKSWEYSEIFALDATELRYTNLVTHSIEAGDLPHTSTCKICSICLTCKNGIIGSGNDETKYYRRQI